MKFFPAIDLKQGKCVRLYQGDMNQATLYNNFPADQAITFMDEGAEWIHVVDLDGAFAGESKNRAAVKEIINISLNKFENLPYEGKVKIQLGGGIRSIQAIQAWLSVVDRVILGTAAVKDPELVKQACKLFPNQIVLGIDAKEGFVATEGWAEKSDISVIDLAKRFEDAGAACIVYTDISKDGAMEGANLEGTKQLAEAVNIPVIISGGISSLADLEKAKKMEAGLKSGKIEGVISGRAIYEKAFTVKDAIKLLAS